MNTALHFSSKDHTWETPPELFNPLDREFRFTLDVCALPATAKCETYFTPAFDGLAQRWEGVCWMNPPYGREIVHWMRKAYESAASGRATVVCLVPARTDTKWWWDYARHGEVSLLPGRLTFWQNGEPYKDPAGFPSAVVVFRPGLPSHTRYWDWKTEVWS